MNVPLIFANNKKSGISNEDVAKPLMDFGLHAPTMSFPVPGTPMIESTESESKYGLGRFIEALVTIAEEIKKVVNGIYDKEVNPLKNAPHTQPGWFYLMTGITHTVVKKPLTQLGA